MNKNLTVSIFIFRTFRPLHNKLEVFFCWTPYRELLSILYLFFIIIWHDFSFCRLSRNVLQYLVQFSGRWSESFFLIYLSSFYFLFCVYWILTRLFPVVPSILDIQQSAQICTRAPLVRNKIIKIAIFEDFEVYFVMKYQTRRLLYSFKE